MSERQPSSEPPEPARPELPGAIGPIEAYRSLPPDSRRRIMAIGAGGLIGLGFGIALAWTIGIFQRANPQGTVISANPGNLSPAYPPMGLTVVVVVIAGLAIGLGLGTLVAALIPHAEPGGPGQDTR